MRALARLLLVALVVLAVVALWWLDALRDREAADRPGPAARHEPGHYFEDFRLHAHDGSGRAGYVLTGRRLVRYADDGTAEVTAPDLRYRPDTGTPWHATGRRGHLDPAADRVDLAGDVVLRGQPATGPATVIETARLTVFTAAGRAETDQPVTARRPGWRVSAVGMVARFEAGTIELQADVRGRYAPNAVPDR